MEIRDIEFVDRSKGADCKAERPCFYLARTIDNGSSFVVRNGVIEMRGNKEVIIFCCSKDNNVVYWPSGGYWSF